MTRTINIAEDFTRYPGGRYPRDGEGNGTDFRDRFLVPILKDHDKAVIILDGAAGYPSSFLDEAFAGLVRNEGFSADVVLASFELVAKEPGFNRVIEMISRYVREAGEKKVGAVEAG
ncbi:STAS-like domain-containing protein [Roseovarius sp. THAF27]|uniref:STAS-like domain-containing protein n=1 Tax=Roseovarius sp. THAF27 TaxID=2587850 RepID=UPI001267D419|nr:STAS-like domain-containing protein [Roseovarius sp. THAF27]